MKLRTPALCLTLIFCLVTMIGSARLSAEPEDAPLSTTVGTDKADSGETIPTYVQRRIFKKVWKEKEVDFLIRSAAVGDFDGDGLKELITTNGKKLRLAQWNHGEFRTPPSFAGEEERRSSFFGSKKSEGVDPLVTINDSNRNLDYITLTAGDFDGNGRDEILYTGMVKNQLRSGILAYRKEQFTDDPGEPGTYLQFFRTADGEAILAGQRLASEDAKVHRYDWNGEAFVQGDALALPDDVKLFSTHSHYSQDALASAYVSLTDTGTIQFYGAGLDPITAVDSHETPTLCSIRVRSTGKDGDTVKKRFDIPKRFLTGDFDGDGRDEVLLIVKRPVVDVRGLRSLLVQNTVANLVLSNGSIREYWNTKPIFEEILDQTVGDIDNNGRDELILFTKKGLIPFLKGTQILIYELNLQGNGTG
ncbi:MAG: VCBS repeat-containing protein [bacterium]|nr:VCBS repeat-containing protein [bacterium]